MKITELTAVTLGKKIKAKEITVAEAVSAVLEQIEAVEGDVHAYVTLKDKEKVLKKAEEIQAKIDAGELDGPLALIQRIKEIKKGEDDDLSKY